MKHFAFFIREAFTNVARGGILTAAATLAVTFAALIVAVFATGYYNLRAIYVEAKSELYVDVYLKEEVDEARAAEVGAHLRRLAGVSRADYISREDAAREFQGLFPEDGELLAAAGDNPLPASYRVYLSGAAATPEAVTKLVKDIMTIDGVDDAVYGQEWLANLERAARLVALVGAAVGAVLGGAAVLVVMSTIGLAVYARRDTVAVLKVIGATDGFVRAPFVVEGFIIGLVGGLAALGALYGGVELLRTYGVEVRFLPLTYIAAGLGVSALGSAFGSALAVRRFLRV